MKLKRRRLFLWTITFLLSLVLLIWISLGLISPIVTQNNNFIRTLPYVAVLVIFIVIVSIIGAIGSNLSRETIFENYNRARIYALIDQNPGIHSSEIQKTLRLGNGQVHWHLSCLKNFDIIKLEKKGKFTLIFPNINDVFETLDIDFVVTMKSETRSKLYQEICLKPGLNQMKLKTNLSVSQSTLAYHLAILEQMKLIDIEKKGRYYVYFPKENSVTFAVD